MALLGMAILREDIEGRGKTREQSTHKRQSIFNAHEL